MQHFRITVLVAAIGAALLLGAASAAPSAALATTGLGTDGTAHQYYWPSSSYPYGGNGYGWYNSAYPYPGSGTAAWYGSGYPYSGMNWYPGSGYYPGSYGNGYGSAPYEGSPGYPYNYYGPHYGYGQPAYVNPSYSPWAPVY